MAAERVVAPTKVEAAPVVAVRHADRADHVKAHARTAVARNDRTPTKFCRGDDAWCLRDDVQAADRALRAAYADAGEAGVPYYVMVAAKRNWDRLRRLSDDDPRALIRGYDALTRQLRAEAAL